MPDNKNDTVQSESPVKSVAKALQVLNCFTADHNNLNLTYISQKLNLPKSTAFNLLSTLVEWGYLIRDSNHNYRLGYKLLELGYCIQSNLPVVQAALPFMEQLQLQTEEIIYLTSHIDGKVLYLEALYPTIRVGNYSSAGKTLPMYCTGCGKAMMAYLPKEELENIMDANPLVRKTPNTITDRDKLIAELSAIRERGYATDIEEESPGIKCVAVAIRDNDGYPVGALSVSGSPISMPDDVINRYAKIVARVCQEMKQFADQFPAAQIRQVRT